MKPRLPFKLGLKLWSSNIDLAAVARRACDDGVFDYIELYVVPKTESLIPAWRDACPSLIIHCPHMSHGFNLASSELRASNKTLFSEEQLFADKLAADTIIVHSGNGGPLEEPIAQFRGLSDPRVCVENKPRIGLNGAICLGTTPEEIRIIMSEGQVHGFALDFSHAVCTANSLNLDLSAFLRDFLKLNPRIFHFNDGNREMVHDAHLNLGRGSFDLPALLRFIPAGVRVSLETPRATGGGLEDFLKDREALVALLKEGQK